MKCSQLLFGAVSLGVVVLIYLTTSAHCDLHDNQVKLSDEQNNSSNKLFIEGWRHEKDKVLFNETITREKSEPLIQVSKEIMYPPRSDNGDYILTLIEVVDIGKGGCLNWTSGGMGHPYVMFNLKANKNEEYEFLVTIYGYKFD